MTAARNPTVRALGLASLSAHSTDEGRDNILASALEAARPGGSSLIVAAARQSLATGIPFRAVATAVRKIVSRKQSSHALSR